MKSSKKIILLIILVAAIVIIFYPKEKDIIIEGYWTTEKIVANNSENHIQESVHIYNDQIAINEFRVFDNSSYTFQRIGKDSIVICCKEDTLLVKDNLDYLKGKNKDLEGKYKINSSAKIIGGGKKAYYDIRLELVSKNKSISLYRTEPVKWEKGLQRGVP